MHGVFSLYYQEIGSDQTCTDLRPKHFYLAENRQLTHYLEAYLRYLRHPFFVHTELCPLRHDVTVW